jgi:predicted dehydrogenase
MKAKPRWGILATGWIAELFVNDLNLTGHTVTAVGSRSKASADRFAERFRIPKAHGSYEALAADPDVDVIYVATPHPMHAANAKLALSAGKHVLVEKAFTINAQEAKALAALAKSKKLVVLEAMWTRFLPHMVEVRKIVASGVLGELRSLIADHTQDLPDDPAHRLNAMELGGGALLDLGIYPISFAWDIFGQPKSIQATANFKATGADAQVATLFQYKNGACAVTLSASDCAGPNRATLIGTEGRIEIDPVWYEPSSFRVYDSKHRVTREYKSKVVGRGMQFQADEIERLILAGATAGELLPPSQTIAIMQTLDTIRGQIGLKYPSERKSRRGKRVSARSRSSATRKKRPRKSRRA